MVSYIPDELGAFLDGLRSELVAGCIAQSHVSVLPPREVHSPEAAERQLERLLADYPPFTVELQRVAIFEPTSVVYIELGAGRLNLERLHHRVNAGALASAERFAYHPHVTLAQEFPPDEVASRRQLAERRWAEYTGPRSFTLEQLSLVQNTERNCWVDLRHYSLNPVGVLEAGRV